ncbi:hypothetical protein C8Q77DRAFT_230472 [Trametes polyzona]|nr:hypothetical protein C8Q77DRAFT_230472 [Trametes polyzona]
MLYSPRGDANLTRRAIQDGDFRVSSTEILCGCIHMLPGLRTGLLVSQVSSVPRSTGRRGRYYRPVLTTPFGHDIFYRPIVRWVRQSMCDYSRHAVLEVHVSALVDIIHGICQRSAPVDACRYDLAALGAQVSAALTDARSYPGPKARRYAREAPSMVPSTRRLVQITASICHRVARCLVSSVVAREKPFDYFPGLPGNTRRHGRLLSGHLNGT